MLYLALAGYLASGVLAALMAANETAVLMLTPGRVHRLAEASRPGADSLEALFDIRHRVRAVAALLGGVAFAASAVFGGMLGALIAGESSSFSAFAKPAAAISAVLVGTALVLLTYALAQALPRTLSVTNPERLALGTARFGLTVTRALYPFVGVLGEPWKWAVSVAGGQREYSPWAVTPEWRGSSSEEQGARDETEEALLEAVSDFAEKVVREVMVPRTDMKAIADSSTIADAVDLIFATGFTRIPVFHETVDDIRGVLYAKDLLKSLVAGELSRPVLAVSREPYFVPETKPVDELLVELRVRTHIAIVADEYGGTAGLITLEDLLEEIVGDISDEYDSEEPLVEALGNDRYRVDARLSVNELNELLGTDFDTEADSVGGLFTEVSGRIPDRGESVDIEGVRFTVTELQGTRIRQLSVEPTASAT